MSTVTVFSSVSAPTTSTIVSASLPSGSLFSVVVQQVNTLPSGNNSVQFPIFNLDITQTNSGGEITSACSTITSPTFQTPIDFTGTSLTFALTNVSEGTVSVFVENR